MSPEQDTQPKGPARDASQASGVARGLSITHKLLALIGSTTSAVVIALAAFFLVEQISTTQQALKRKAAAYATLTARQVASAIAFDDRETAREVFDAVAQDQDVESLTLFDAQGQVLHARGAAGSWIAAAKHGVRAQRMVELEDRIAVVTPVVSAEGPRGTLVIELSMQRLHAAIHDMTKQAVAVGAGMVLLGMLLAYAIARSLGRRIECVAKAAVAVAGGDFDQPPLAVVGADEVAHLARGFNTMVRQIQRLFAQARETAASEKTRLESLVKARTQELDHRNADMRLVLDNVSQGFLTVDLDGRMSLERSAIVDSWLGAPSQGQSFFDYIERAVPGKGAYMRVGWEALREDWMPLEMRLDQLPAEFENANLHLGLSYQPILEGGELSKLLVIVTDIAPLAERRRAEEEEREIVQAVRRLLSDHHGFRDYMDEAAALVADATAPQTGSARRQRVLHTLKGTSAIFGFESIARLCHELEDNLQNGAELSEADRQRLQACWQRLEAKVEVLLGGRSTDLLEVRREDVKHVVANLNARARHSLIAGLIHAWDLEPAEARLARLAEHAHALATRLEKDPMVVVVEPNDVRLHPTDWTSFWHALVHVVRNAVDHGLEGPQARRDAGKPEAGQITLRTQLDGQRLQVSVEDDGAGIDWKRVAKAAAGRGLEARTHEQLVAAMFADGMSTRDQASDTSGRGVGLSAVRETCNAIGGSVDIVSEPGRGTKFCFSFTVDVLGRPALGLEKPRAAGSPGGGDARRSKTRNGGVGA